MQKKFLNSKEISVLIVYTGGTIGMINDPVMGSYRPVNFKNLSKKVPDLKSFGYKLDTISFEPPIDSSNMKPDSWIKIAKLLKKKHALYDGFVILHGTDTMAYTASALSFMLQNFNKPVILTGSQLPIETLRTDGKENLITAIEIAASKRKGQAKVPEVCIYFENKLFRGNRTTKRNATFFDAFESPNYVYLAKAGIKIKYNYKAIKYHDYSKIPFINTNLNTNIAILKVFPGINENVVKAITETKKLEAIVLETFGSGNCITDDWFINLLSKAIDKGIIILNITQCLGGTVSQGKYTTSVLLKKIGVISGYDMTTEAAVTKLMLLLELNLPKKEIIYYINKSIAGELTEPD